MQVVGKNKEEKYDKEISQYGEKKVKELNKKYECENFPIFHFLYRKRIWNPKEKAFLGWERKRGLLTQFNNFLLDPKTNDFRSNTILENLNKLPKIKYIITLDADTNLVLNSGLELIGAMEHILNTPVVEQGVVKEGHALIQPRVGVDLQSSFKSEFSRIFAGASGTDVYTNAVSDVYQDNFDEGIFTGKGIYNLQVFYEVLKNQIPENTVLSHDLLEGNYLRCGLANDILLLDGYPCKYNSFMSRLHRWTRGDWQIITWLNNKIIKANSKNGIRETIKNPLGILAKFKIWDNIRRSIVPLNVIILLLTSIILKLTTNIPTTYLVVIAILAEVISMLVDLMDYIIFKKELEDGYINANKSFMPFASGVLFTVYRGLLELSFLPYRAYTLGNAIVKTIYRLTVSKQNLLEWTTAEEAEKMAKTDIVSYYKQMIVNVILGMGLIIFSATLLPKIIATVLTYLLGILWIIAPSIAYKISIQRKENKKVNQISKQEKEHLLDIAKRTWQYFEDNMNEENNYLPPDNYQEDRKEKIAQRTSPTNIGLGLLAIISAIDLNIINLEQGLGLFSKTVNTIEYLPKWNGHLYNWYNTKTLEILTPRYVSSVDSGNFVGYLLTAKQFLIENINGNQENNRKIINDLIEKINKIIDQTDFSKLFDYKKRLFSIGFNVEENKLTDSYYDLLASEARQTSIVAIAKKDILPKHWANLGRTLTSLNKYKGLVSWSGTAFEYLMTNVNVKKYEGSLLDESCKFMVMCQQQYCKRLRNTLGNFRGCI